MNEVSPTSLDRSQSELFALLQEHRTLRDLPEEELRWLLAHGTPARFEAGQVVVEAGGRIEALFVLFKGRLAHFRDAAGAYRKVMEWQGGDVTGQLPYSRLTVVVGRSVVEEPLEALRVPVEYLDALPRECPNLTARLVHVMVDRARAFRSSDLQVEKMASLGKLAAGLAHELNNPASAAARSARLVTEALAVSDEAARKLGSTGLTPAETTLVERIRSVCVDSPPPGVLSPLDQADREEDIADWLIDHNVDDDLAAPLAETVVTIEMLDQLAGTLSGDKLRSALHWVAAGCTVRSLARDIERAASRVHELVTAVKGFTYMDRATVPEPVDVAKGLRDTLAVLAAKARAKSASLTVEIADDLPCVRGFGGELNQIWANLIDNALDAIRDGGRVVVTAGAEGASVVVRVLDDGPGIPDDLKGQIFDPFFTTKPVRQGTGLGLDIVRRLVEQNGGLIEVSSEPGRTEFRVTLPAEAS